MAASDGGPITRFPADDLRPIKRFITSHNTNGRGIFFSEDDGDHHRVMVRGKASANIIYSTSSNPVDLNNEVDIDYAHKNEVLTGNPASDFPSEYTALPLSKLTQSVMIEKPSIHISNGSVARMIDFAPGIESPLHRALSIDYGVMIEGVMELELDGGERRTLYPGDMSVNRGANHIWRNPDKSKSARMLFVLLDCKPLFVNGTEIVQDLGDLTSEYPDHK